MSARDSLQGRRRRRYLPGAPAAYSPFIVAFAVMVVLVIAGIVLIAASDGTAEDVGKELLPASIVGLSVALVAAILDDHAQERSAAEAARERVLRELVAARDYLETTHLLVQAHRSGATYSHQLIQLVHAQGSMRFARAQVQATVRDTQVFDVPLLAKLLREVYDFVGTVTAEYRTRYVEVAEAQDNGDGNAWHVIESFPSLQRFLDPLTFEVEVREKLRDALKSVQESAGGIPSATSQVPE